MLVAAMLLSAGSIFANNPKGGDEPSKSLSSQIGKLLDQNNLTLEEEGNSAQVLFILNSAKEIVVLNVDTDDTVLDKFIKARLNYQEIQLGSYEVGKRYTVSVRVKA